MFGDTKNRNFVRRVLSPLIAVISSPELDEVCQANKLNAFVDLIKPFSTEIPGKVTIRDNRGQPRSHSNFSVRFRDLRTIQQCDLMNEDPIKVRNLADIIKNKARNLPKMALNTNEIISDNSSNNIINDDDEIENELPRYHSFVSELLKMDWSELTPWFDIYKEMFFENTRLSDHETFDHPVACIVATSAHNVNPIETLSQLYKQNNYLDKLSFVDPERTYCYVLVHDARLGSFDKTQEIFSLVKKTFGTMNSHLLVINSKPSQNYSEVEPTVKDVWSNLNNEISGDKLGVCGQLLTLDDVESIQNLVRKIVVESVLPSMERSLHFLNEQVASSRRGFTGRLFSASRRYFGTGKSISPTNSLSNSISPSSNSGLSSPTPSIPTTQYHYSTPEAQLRKLADTAFMLRDYEFARSTYETVKKDFQADSAWRFYAGTQEMIGICLLFSEGSGAKIEMDRYYDKPIHYYLTLKMPTWAARSALLYHAMFKYHHRYRDIPLLLVRLTGEDSDIRSALFLEQAAYGYLKTTPPKVRKFAFHLILAGHNFNKCNQREHAYNCYNLASNIFCNIDDVKQQGKKWNLIEDHINFSLGRQSLYLGELKQAIRHFSTLIMDSTHTPGTQAGYMKEFLYIYKNYLSSTNHEILLDPEFALSIPTLDRKQLKITYLINDEEIYDSIKEINTTRLRFEKDITGYEINSPLNGIIVNPNSKIIGSAFCIDEPFTLEISISNPLKITITLCDITLDYAYEDLSIHEGLLIQPVPSIILEGKESHIIKFHITPKTPGQLQFNSITFKLNDIAKLRHSLSMRGKRLNSTPEQMRGTFYDKDLRGNVYITPKMPRLQVGFYDFPDEILSGQIYKTTLWVHNVGEEKATNLSVKTSHPTFFTFENPDDQEHQSEYSLLFSNQIKYNPEIQLFPKKNSIITSIDPNQKVEFAVYIRGDRIGNHNFEFVFSYGIEDSKMKEYNLIHRIKRLTWSLIVQPSLKINAFTRPSNKGLDSFVLGIEVENVQALKSFSIKQVISSSHFWEIKRLNKGTDNPSNLLFDSEIDPRQSIFIYFSIDRIEKSNSDYNCLPNDLIPEMQLATSLQSLVLGLKDFDDYPKIPLNIGNVELMPSINNINKDVYFNFYMNSRSHHRSAWLNKEMSFIDQSLHSQIFPLFYANDIDFILVWEAHGQETKIVHQGCHHIIGINFGISQNHLLDFTPKAYRTITNKLDNAKADSEIKIVRSLFENTALEKNRLISSIIQNPRFKNEIPVKVMLKFPEVVYHDYSTDKLAITEVTFFIKNCSWNRTLDITLNLLSGTSTHSKNSSIDIIDNKSLPQLPVSAQTHSRKLSKGTNSPIIKPKPIDESTITAQSLHSDNVYSSGYYWASPLQFTAKISPSDRCEFKVNVAFTSFGTFNLNLWRVDLAATTASHGREDSKSFLKALNSSLGYSKDNTSSKLLSSKINFSIGPTIPSIIRIMNKNPN